MEWSKLKSTVMDSRFTTLRQPHWNLVSQTVNGVLMSSNLQAGCEDYKVKRQCVCNNTENYKLQFTFW